MDEQRKNAYRHLLYQAMLEIRGQCQSRGKMSYQPLLWWRQYRSSRVAGALADWLHNLAKYASRDFVGFKEDWFWKEHDGFVERFGEASWTDYKKCFQDELKRPA